MTTGTVQEGRGTRLPPGSRETLGTGRGESTKRTLPKDWYPKVPLSDTGHPRKVQTTRERKGPSV